MLVVHHKVHSSIAPTPITDQAIIIQAVREAIETNNLPMLRLIAYDNGIAMHRNREAIAQYDKLYIDQWYVKLQIEMLEGILSYIIDHASNQTAESLVLTPEPRPSDYRPFNIELERLYPRCGLVLIPDSLEQQAAKFEEKATASCYILNVSNTSERGNFYFFDYILGTFTHIPLEEAITQSLLEEFVQETTPIDATYVYSNLTSNQLNIISQWTLHTIPERSKELFEICDAHLPNKKKNLFDTLNESLTVRRTSPFLRAVIYAGFQAVIPHYMKGIGYFSSINWLIREGDTYLSIEPGSSAATDLSDERKLHVFSQIFSRVISDLFFDDKCAVDENTGKKVYSCIENIEQINRKALALQLGKSELDEQLNTLASRLKLCEAQMTQDEENKEKITFLRDAFITGSSEYESAHLTAPACGFLELTVPPNVLNWDMLETSNSLSRYYGAFNEQWFYIDVTKRKWLELPMGEARHIIMMTILKCEKGISCRGRSNTNAGFINYGEIQNLKSIEDYIQHKSALYEITQFAHRLLSMQITDWNIPIFDNGFTALQYAVAHELREFALFIVQQPGIDVFALNREGCSVLDIRSPSVNGGIKAQINGAGLTQYLSPSMGD